jgi:hypothetical protein
MTLFKGCFTNTKNLRILRKLLLIAFPIEANKVSGSDHEDAMSSLKRVSMEH